MSDNRELGRKSHEPCRVLCVDDNRDLADMESLMLGLSGFDTRVCYDGYSALKIAENYCPKVCLIDLNMPGMDGDELALKLKEIPELKETRMVALTARSCDDSHLRIQTAGFDLHLIKPVEPTRLVDFIHGLCHNSYVS